MSVSACISCGQCVTVCPVGCLSEKTVWRQVADLLESKRKVGVGAVSVKGPARRDPSAASTRLPRASIHTLGPTPPSTPTSSPLSPPPKVMVAQTAPSVRVAIGEELGMAPGAVSTGQMVAALRRLGFDYVFDTGARRGFLGARACSLACGVTAKGWPPARAPVSPCGRRRGHSAPL
jgi:iron only hydrogenase large subunit-like protein